MNGERLLFDTNCLIYFLDGRRFMAPYQDSEILISFVSEMELRSKPGISAKELKIVEALLQECTIINMNQEIKEIAIGLRRKNKMKLPDAIVASTALFMNVPLLTADKDFVRIKEIDLVLIEY